MDTFVDDLEELFAHLKVKDAVNHNCIFDLQVGKKLLEVIDKGVHVVPVPGLSRSSRTGVTLKGPSSPSPTGGP
jgi:hypothetical protein